MNKPKDIEKLTFQELQNLIDEYCLTPQNIREILVVGQMFRNSTTIEEVKKEWEDDGWEWKEGNSIIDLKHKKYKYFIRLNLLTKTYGCYFLKNIGQESSFGSGRKIYELCSHTITLKEHIRLTKTFIAKGWKV